MTPEQLHALIDAVIALIVAITGIISTLNAMKLSDIHAKVKTIDTNTNGSKDDPESKPGSQ